MLIGSYFSSLDASPRPRAAPSICGCWAGHWRWEWACGPSTFVGKLVLRLPSTLGFDLDITALIVGAGISSMHYTGMAAMRMMPASVTGGWLHGGHPLRRSSADA